MTQSKRTTHRRMTRNERREARQIKKAKRDAKYVKWKMHFSMNWIDITDVTRDSICLGNGRKHMMVKGFKLRPHNIFIDDEADQRYMIERLESCLNNCPDNLYFGFVLNPVNMSEYTKSLGDMSEHEDDMACKQMMNDEAAKASEFCRLFRELEFYVMIRDTKDERLAKRLNDLYSSFESAGLAPRPLDKLDFYNYTSYLFETPSVNDFIFDRDVLSYLHEAMVYQEEVNAFRRINYAETFEKYGYHDPVPNFMPDRNLILRSKIPPSQLHVYRDYMKIGEKYVANLLVKQFPKNFGLAILSSLTSSRNIKVLMRTNRYNEDFASVMRSEYLEKLRDYQTTTDPARRAMLEENLVSQNNYINEVISRNDTTFDIILVFSVFADDLEHLNLEVKDFRQKLTSSGFKVLRPELVQDQLFRIATPLWIDPGVRPIVIENFGFPIPSYGVAGMWPYIFDTMKDRFGFLLGHERQNGGMIKFDPFYYLDAAEDDKDMQRANGNIILVGESGSGKTTALGLFIRDFIRSKVKIVWIDPENMSAGITKHYNGTYIDWGVRGNIINIFDLKPISGEEDDDESFRRMWDTEAAIFNVIEDVNVVLKYLFPDMDERVFSLTGDIVFAAYAKVGIKKENGTFPPFKGMAYEQMPTFTTFIDCLHEQIEAVKKETGMDRELLLLNDLDINMNRIKNEWSIYFNGHTTITIPESGRQMITFGTKKLNTAQSNLQSALYYIMFTYAWTLCLDEKERSAFIIDEAHTLILKGNTAGLVSQFYRRSRKYHNAMMVASQEPHDFADPKVLTDGKAIFNNADYKIIMKLKKDACDDVSKLERINPTEANLIMDQGIGDALFISGERRIPIHIWATKDEIEEMKRAKESSI